MSRGSRPLYARLLRLRHLRLSQLTSFILFEGSVLIAVLLSLAEIIDWWGVLLVPATVAVMVKLNDGVAGILARPEAIAQVVRPGVLSTSAVGWSPVPVAARITGEIDRDDAVADPDAQPEPRIIRGIATVPNGAERRPPSPGLDVPRPAAPDARVRGNQGRFVS